MIYGAKVIELGRVNDHRPFIVDEETLSEVVAFGNRPNNGIKVRFTHTQESLGNHLGRAVNFYRRGQENCVRCDIRLVKAAKLAPFNAYDYIISLATEDPEALGLSIAFMMDTDVTAVDGLLPVRIRKLYSVDFVGDPNATRGGLFSTESEESMTIEEKLEGQIEEKFEEKAEEVVKDEVVQDEMLASEEVKEEEKFEEAPAEEKVELAVDVPDYEAYIEAFGEQGAVWYLRGKPLNECFAEYLHNVNQENEALKAELFELKSQIEAFSAGMGEAEPAAANADIQLSEAEVRHQEFVAQKKEQGWSDKEIRWANLFTK